LVFTECGAVGEVPVVWADLAHVAALAYDDLQAVLAFPVALALDRHVDALVGAVSFDVEVGADPDM
jgi:hypothetical protein